MNESLNKPPLKVAVFLSAMEVPAWIYKLLERINDSTYASVEVIVLNGGGDTKTCNEPVHGLLHKGRQSMVTRIQQLQEGFSNRYKSYPDYNEKHDLKTLLNTVSIEVFEPLHGHNEIYFRDDDIKQLEQYDVDVLLNLDENDLRGDVTEAFPYGVWHYIFTDKHTNYQAKPGARETLADWPETSSALLYAGKSLNDDKVITQSYSCPDNTWIHKTNNLNYWKSLSFMPRALERCHRLGKAAFYDELCRNTPHPLFLAKEPPRGFGKLEMLSLLMKKAFQKVQLRINDRLFYEQWFLLFNLNPATSNVLDSYQYILPPKDRFWADPFVIYRDNRYYIFFEELLFAEDRGFLSVMTIDQQGRCSEPEVILKEDYHLSYPFVFEHEGEFFMIPESAQNKTIDLYRCTGFPNQWVHEMTLMKNVHAVDATLFFKDNKWWMFTNIKENEGASSHEELFLFYSESLMSENWVAHPANPIISDVKKARPAGKIIEKNGKLYRPSQNCSRYYGYGLNFNEITVINEHSYQEHTVTSIEPNWDKKVIATHTFNTDHDITIIDGIIRRSHYR
ncbi:MAG: Unknown protein [uncultured Thiotrichaceae bacterium]|uniref:Glucosamine inositolphosphorylceramide transferase 1 N-terminal domain-containing protein n=1 Tax=uncultured Thiotrichaceae bacterium TaxID=298394 RepID=A0A6S6TB01_9GAMM|nr:MAG: Unknown protein [uncultured Thiotrichaceae bacterium]